MDTCRICLSPSTPEDPLFSPCKCSGSIKYVHADCLLEWVAHLRYKMDCSVCGHKYAIKAEYSKPMGDPLTIMNYISYFLHVFSSNMRFVLVALGIITTWNLLSSAVYFLLRLTFTLTEIYLANASIRSPIKHAFLLVTNQPDLESKLPIVDYLLHLVFPKRKWLTYLVNGNLFTVSQLFLGLQIVQICASISEDKIVIYDLERIARGYLSHMDDGTADELLERSRDIKFEDRIVEVLNKRAPVEMPEEFRNRFQVMVFEHLIDEVRNPINLKSEDVLTRPSSGDVFADQRLPEDILPEEIDDALDGDEEPVVRVLMNILVQFVNMDMASLVSLGFACVVVFSVYIFVLNTFYFVFLVNLKTLQRVAFPQFSWTPTSAFGYTMCIASMFATSVCIFRILNLLMMKRLMKSLEGRRFLMFQYIVHASFKTIFFTIVETLLFPTFCGVLFHVVLLPLSQNWRVNLMMVQMYPYTAFFIHLVGGLIYMFFIQHLVTAARQWMRPGVLYFFYRSNSTYTMRTMMFVSLPRQVRRIAFSALIYALSILLGAGATVLLLLSLRSTKFDVFVKVSGAQLVRLWPFAFGFMSMFVTLENGTVNAGNLRKIAMLYFLDRSFLNAFVNVGNKLDLDSWLFNKKKVVSKELEKKLNENVTTSGYFVRAPVDLPPLQSLKSNTLFVKVDESNKPMFNRQPHKHDLKEYAVVWRPTYFKLRLAALALGVWAHTTVNTLTLTKLSWAVGYAIDFLFYNMEIKNDFIRWLIGFSIVLPCTTLVLIKLQKRELVGCMRYKMWVGKLPTPGISDLTPQLDSAVLAILYINGAMPLKSHFKLLALLANLFVGYLALAVFRLWFKKSFAPYMVALAVAGAVFNGGFGMRMLLWLPLVLYFLVFKQFMVKGLDKKVYEHVYFVSYRVMNYEE